MKTVIQEDNNGCGLACVAMLAGEAYSTIKTRYVNYIQKKYGGRSEAIGFDDIKMFLRDYNIKISNQKNFDDWNDIVVQRKNEALLVAINGKDLPSGDDFWHWVIYDGENNLVRDPNNKVKNHERTDFSRMRPYFFHTLTGH